MKKTLAVLLVTAATPSFALDCSYVLDATQAQFDQYPVLSGWEVAPPINDQKIDFLVPETGTGGKKLYGAFSSAGVTAMTASYNANLPGGDLPLPASGIVRMKMQLDSFPTDTFSRTEAASIGLNLVVMTGNQQSGLPKDSLQYNITIFNTNRPTNPLYYWISGQSISGSSIANINQQQPFTPPVPYDVVGFSFNMDTRAVSITAHAAGTPADAYLEQPLTDTAGNPVLLPAGVSSVALGLGGIILNTQTGETQVGKPVGATLVTDICAAGSNPVLLPNGKPFPGKGKAKGLQK